MTTENAKQTLARISRAHVVAQLKHGVQGVREIRLRADTLDEEALITELALALTRTLQEMAVATALGDQVARLDLLVLSHVRELFSVECAAAVLERVYQYGGAWPHTVTPWPLQRFQRSPLPAPVPPWWVRTAHRFQRWYRGVA